MPEELITPLESNTAGESDETLGQRLPLDASGHAWQPLQPEASSGDDLASIFQSASTLRQRGTDEEDLIWSTPNDEPVEVSPDVDQRRASTWTFDQAELAALAETVFDTTFYLVPWVSEHYLLGDIAQHLRTWMPALCERYGWELGLLSIRPDYLKWTLLDFPECLTRQMLAVVRQWVSERIFEVFPDLQGDRPERDFWSPGYLVDTLNRDFPTQDLITHLAREQAAPG